VGYDAIAAASFLFPRPADGATSIVSTFSWNLYTNSLLAWLPDASKGDSVYVIERIPSILGSGASEAIWYNPTKYQKLTNVTITDSGGSIAASLIPAPQTGLLSADLRLSQFAALTSTVNPAATPSDLMGSGILPFLGVGAGRGGDAFPDAPFAPRTSLAYLSIPVTNADVNYGTLSHGQVLDGWSEYSRFYYYWDVPLTSPATATSSIATAQYVAEVPKATHPGSVVPVISPVTNVTLNGANAFTSTTGAGIQPTISWSAPSIGVATSYVVSVTGWSANPQENDVYTLTAVLYGGNFFTLPPGFLKSGGQYTATVTAVHSEATLDSPIWAQGGAYYSADSMFGMFMP
jgi:hypothetical protein